MTKSSWLFVGTTTLALAAALALSVLVGEPSLYAFPQPAHNFFGEVTVTGVSPTSLGAVVEARIGNVNYARPNANGGNVAIQTNGNYGQGQSGLLLQVCGDSLDTDDKEGGRDGDVIEFYVGNVKAVTTDRFGTAIPQVAFDPGTVTQLNLVLDPNASRIPATADTFGAACKTGDEATPVPRPPPPPPSGGGGEEPTATPTPIPAGAGFIPPSVAVDPETIVTLGTAGGTALADFAEADAVGAALALRQAFQQNRQAAALALAAAVGANRTSSAALFAEIIAGNLEEATDILESTFDENAAGAGQLTAATAAQDAAAAASAVLGIRVRRAEVVGQLMAEGVEADAISMARLLLNAGTTDVIGAADLLRLTDRSSGNAGGRLIVESIGLDLDGASDVAGQLVEENADDGGGLVVSAGGVDPGPTGRLVARIARDRPAAMGASLVSATLQSANVTRDVLIPAAAEDVASTNGAMAAGPAQDPVTLALIGALIPSDAFFPGLTAPLGPDPAGGVWGGLFSGGLLAASRITPVFLSFPLPAQASVATAALGGIEAILARFGRAFPDAKIAVRDAVEADLVGVPGLPASQIVNSRMVLSPSGFEATDITSAQTTMFVEKSWLERKPGPPVVPEVQPLRRREEDVDTVGGQT